MPAASTFKSLSISSRLSLGFGCMLVLLVAVAAVGQLSVGKVHDQMTPDHRQWAPTRPSWSTACWRA